VVMATRLIELEAAAEDGVPSKDRLHEKKSERAPFRRNSVACRRSVEVRDRRLLDTCPTPSVLHPKRPGCSGAHPICSLDARIINCICPCNIVAVPNSLPLDL